VLEALGGLGYKKNKYESNKYRTKTYIVGGHTRADHGKEGGGGRGLALHSV
jgi:hypothetical protein